MSKQKKMAYKQVNGFTWFTKIILVVSHELSISFAYLRFSQPYHTEKHNLQGKPKNYFTFRSRSCFYTIPYRVPRAAATSCEGF